MFKVIESELLMSASVKLLLLLHNVPNPGMALVKNFWTLSIFVTSCLLWGLQTGEQYSRIWRP